MIPPFPFRFRNAEILTLYWRTDPDAMAFLVPPPLRAEGDVACVHIYKMNDTDWLGPYSEANVMFGAALGRPAGGLFAVAGAVVGYRRCAWARSAWPAEKAGRARRWRCGAI